MGLAWRENNIIKSQSVMFDKIRAWHSIRYRCCYDIRMQKVLGNHVTGKKQLFVRKSNLAMLGLVRRGEMNLKQIIRG